MSALWERIRLMFSQCDCSHSTSRQRAKLTASYASGVLKGILMLPIILPAYVLGVTLINIVAFPLWLDHGYASLFFTRLFGRNLKIPIGIAYPIALLLFFAFSIALSVPFALVFVLIYPGFITAEVKMQTAWRYAYFWAGWNDTFVATYQNLLQYWYTVSIGARDSLRTVRRKAWEYQYEVHPSNLVLAFLTVPLGGSITAVLSLLSLALKFPFLIVRAYVNHFRGSSLWFRGPVLTTLWILALPLLPVGIALLLPAAIGYSYYESVKAAGMVLKLRGAILPAIAHLAASAGRVHRESSRYMVGQDVPFLILPASTPISIPWLIIGILPTVFSVAVTVPMMLIVVLMSVIPVLVSCWSKIMHKITTTSGSTSKPYLLPLLILAIPLAIPATIIVLFGIYIIAVLDGLTAILVTHSKRSLGMGFQYIAGVNYVYEYKINKFAFAADRYQQVHWASVLPQSWALMARPYMDAAEWDAGGFGIPSTIVGKPARYVPPGLRRPKYLEDGTVVDMTIAAYDVPGIGITQVDADGGLGLPLPKNMSAVNPKQLSHSQHHSSHHKQNLYTMDILPYAYKLAIEEAALAVAQKPANAHPNASVPIPASLAGFPREDAEALIRMVAQMSQGGLHSASSFRAGISSRDVAITINSDGSVSPLIPSPSSPNTPVGGHASDHDAHVAAVLEDEESHQCCMCFSGIHDGYEEDDVDVLPPVTPHGGPLPGTTPAVSGGSARSVVVNTGEVHFTADTLRRKAAEAAKRKAMIAGANAAKNGASASAASSTSASSSASASASTEEASSKSNSSNNASSAGDSKAATTVESSSNDNSSNKNTEVVEGAAKAVESSGQTIRERRDIVGEPLTVIVYNGAGTGAETSAVSVDSASSTTTTTTAGGALTTPPPSSSSAALDDESLVTDAMQNQAAAAVQRAAEALASASTTAAAVRSMRATAHGADNNDNNAGTGDASSTPEKNSNSSNNDDDDDDAPLVTVTGSLLSPISPMNDDGSRPRGDIATSASANTGTAKVPASAAAAPPHAGGQGSNYNNNNNYNNNTSEVGQIQIDDDDEEVEDDDEDEDEVFVLQPIVNAALPDIWVETPGPDGAPYYVNYARNQSSWRVPPGWSGAVRQQ